MAREMNSRQSEFSLWPSTRKVHVIRHVAVRSYRHALIDCCALDLRTHKSYVRRFNEVSLTVESAERQEILVKSEVIEPLQMFRSAGEHAAHACKMNVKSG